MFKSSLSKPDGTSFHQIANETHVVTPAVRENCSNVTRPNLVSMSATSSDTRFRALEASCGRETRDDWNTVSDPQDHQKSTNTSDGTTRNTWWSEVRKSRNGDCKVLETPALWTIWSTPLFHLTQDNPYRPSLRNFKAQKVSFTTLMIALSRRQGLRPTNEQSSNT